MLQRSIGKGALVLLLINGVIGSGIFGLPAKAFQQIGSWSLPAFGVCALAVFAIIACFAEVSSRFDQTGGPYLYALASFGPLPAFLTGWLLLLTRFITYAALINLLLSYLAVFFPFPATATGRPVLITGITALLAFVNHLGIRNSTRVNNVLTVSKLLPLVLFIAAGLFFVDPARFDFSALPSFSSFSSTVLLLVFAFGGFESVLVNSGEVKDPARTLPFALITATIVIATVYILVQLVSIGTLPTLASADKPLAEAAARFMGTGGAHLIAVGAVVSVLGTLNAILLVGSRLPYAFSREKHFPLLFSYVHPRYKTPSWSLLLFTGVTILVSLYYSFLSAASLSAITRVMIYAIVCATLLILRKKQPEQTGHYRLRHGKITAVFALAVTGWLLAHSRWQELRDIALALGLGVLVYFLGRRR